MGAWPSYRCRCTAYYPDSSPNSACWMCQVMPPFIAFHSTFTPCSCFAHKLRLPRLCSDGEAVHLHYTTDNSRVYHKEELKSFEIKTEVHWKSHACEVFRRRQHYSYSINIVFLSAHRCCRVSDSFISQICDSRKFPM